MAVRLKNLTICGFKTIRKLVDFQPAQLNVLIGANGTGKSNFVSLFRLLSYMLSSPDGLQLHVGDQGGASALLHDGPERTREIEIGLTLETDKGTNDYAFRLSHVAGDRFMFADERYRFSGHASDGPARWHEALPGGWEPAIIADAEKGDETAGVILALLRKCIVYQFHNTSTTARMRNRWSATDGRWLKEDGANLAPFLMRLREERPKYYQRIVRTIRFLCPFFLDFEFRPGDERQILEWRETGTDMVFNASQASDGMLRMMALVALLGQPAEDLPAVLVLDEPELGLHPSAIETIAGMLKSASRHAQVIVATQSASLVNYFDPDDIVVVERTGRESTFRRLDAHQLTEWLDSYSMSQLWEKNVLGGKP